MYTCCKLQLNTYDDIWIFTLERKVHSQKKRKEYKPKEEEENIQNNEKKKKKKNK